MIDNKTLIGNLSNMWIGVVESRNDNLELGRVRVRIKGYHSDDVTLIPIESLPWALIAMPLTQNRGVPDLRLGDFVAGYFLDSNCQNPIVNFLIPGLRQSNEILKQRLSETSPKEIENQPTPANQLILNEIDKPTVVGRGVDPQVVIANQNLVAIAAENKAKKSAWLERESESNEDTIPTYPHNKVIMSESGHIFEIDDTLGHERIRLQHSGAKNSGKGTFFEMHSDGDLTTKIQRDNYEIILGKNQVFIKGFCSITVEGNSIVHVGGNANLYVKGDVEKIVDGDYSLNVTGDIAINGKTINLNKGDMGAARIGDTADTGDDGTGGHFDLNSPGTNVIETGSSTVFIGD